MGRAIKRYSGYLDSIQGRVYTTVTAVETAAKYIAEQAIQQVLKTIERLRKQDGSTTLPIHLGEAVITEPTEAPNLITTWS